MLTLGTCRKALWNTASNVPFSTANAAQISDFDFKLNQVTERFFSLGTWKAMWKRPTLKIFGTTLTLPRGFDTLRGFRRFCGAAPIYGAFHKFSSFGGHFIDTFSWGGWMSGATLRSESAQTFVIPTGTFTLRAVATDVATPGFTFTGGFDENDNEILATVTLNFINGTTNTTQQYTQLPEIQKVVTNNSVSLYSVDTTTADATLIGVYAPGETLPSYRQYDVGSGADGTLVTGLCKLGFEPAISANDLVVPGNMGALKLGLQALVFEERVDPANAKIYWANAIELLDSECAELDAAEQPEFQVTPGFGAGTVVNVH